MGQVKGMRRGEEEEEESVGQEEEGDGNQL